MEENKATLLGPIQILAVLLDSPKFDGRIADQIAALEEAGVITLIDAAVIVRESEDDVSTLDVDTELFPGRPLLGAVIGGLIGLGAGGEEGALASADLGSEAGIDPVSSEDLLEFAENLPIGAAAAVAVFEQTWARGLMGAVRDSAGTILSDDIIHAEDLIELGMDIGWLSGVTDES